MELKEKGLVCLQKPHIQDLNSGEEHRSFSELMKICTNQEIMDILRKHTNTWSDMETLFMFILLYDFIKNITAMNDIYKTDDHDILRIIFSIFKNSEYRKIVISNFTKYIKGEMTKNKFFATMVKNIRDVIEYNTNKVTKT